MKAQVLANFGHTWLPSLALILFLSVFISMLLMIYRKGTNELYAKANSLPLDEGELK